MLRDTFALHPPAKPFMMILLSIFYWEQMHPFQCITHSNDVTPSSLNRVSISYLWKHGRPIKCIQISILKRKYTSEKCDEIVLRAARSNWTVVEELLRWHQISSAITHPLFFFFLKKKKKKKHVEEELRAQVTRFKRTRKSDPRYNNRNLFLKFAILSSSILQFRNSFVAIHFSNDIKEFHSICQSQEKDQKWCLNGRKIIFTEFLF